MAGDIMTLRARRFLTRGKRLTGMPDLKLPFRPKAVDAPTSPHLAQDIGLPQHAVTEGGLRRALDMAGLARV